MAGSIRLHRIGAAVTVAAVLAAGAAACSGSSDGGAAGTTAAPGTTGPASPGSAAHPSSTAAGAATTAPPTPASTRCRPGDLRLTASEQGASAGHEHQALVFTNTGSAPCTLEGYPGVSFVNGAGTIVGKPAERTANPTPSVRLAPGEQAHASLNITNAYNFGEECGEPVEVATVRVFPPDETTELRTALSTRVCSDLAMARVGPVLPGASAAAGEDLGA